MGKYAGMPCAHCNHKFNESDDVVVCPNCGAPHHRSCYRELGHCAAQDKHAEGYIWQAPVDADRNHRETVKCKSCGTANPKGIGFCQLCQSPLEEEKQAFVPQSYTIHAQTHAPGAEFEVDGITAREISAYVGNGSFYFLRQFQVLLGTSFQISWNWFAFIFKFVYFFYRKMYALGFAVFALSLPSMIPSLLYSIEVLKANSMEMFGVKVAYNAQLLELLSNLAPFINGYSLLVSIGCGLLANRLYLRKVVSDIGFLRKTSGGPAGGGEYYATLYHMGKPNKIVVLFIFVGFFLLYSSIGAHLVSLMGL